MSIKKLYIIGNGFDLHHGIPSSYWHFRNFVKSYNPTLFDVLEKYFNPDQLWSDFEATLADLDTDHILEEASNYLEDYSSEEWSDAFHHDYQYEIGERIKMVTSTLKATFTDWILSLEIPTNKDTLLKLDKQATFLNFNYTSTLSTLYKVEDANIIYIHNRAVDKTSDLLLGHGVNPGALPQRGGEDDDIRVTEGQRIIDGYFLESYKPVDKIIENRQSFFDTLHEIEELIIYGHSMSEVDIPYFKQIIQRLALNKTKWRISYYSLEERDQKLSLMKSFGILEEQITIGRLEDFDREQLTIL